VKIGEQEITAYPLAWPAMRPRMKRRDRAKFSTNGGALSLAAGRDRAMAELQRFRATSIIISSNVSLRRDGLPYSGQPEPADPGVAVYFQIEKNPRVMACDRWDRVADNLAAIAKTIEAQRAMLRHGAVTADQIFAGFKALPGGDSTVTPMTVEQAAQFLSIHGQSEGSHPTADQVIQYADTFRFCFRVAAKAFHPDRNGGMPHPNWITLQQAVQVLEKHHGK